MNSFQLRHLLFRFGLINTSVLVSSDILLERERERERDAGVHKYIARAHNLLKNQLVSNPANFIFYRNNSVNAEIFRRCRNAFWVFQHLKHIAMRTRHCKRSAYLNKPSCKTASLRETTATKERRFLTLNFKLSIKEVFNSYFLIFNF